MSQEACWHNFSPSELANSPSRRDGISAGEEERRVRVAVDLTRAAAAALRASATAAALAAIFVRRLYAAGASLLDLPEPRSAAACLFLACKVAECPPRVSDLLNVVALLRHPPSGGGADGPPPPLPWMRGLAASVPPPAACGAAQRTPGAGGAGLIQGDAYYLAKASELITAA